MSLSGVRVEDETPRLLNKTQLAAKEKRWVKLHHELSSRRIELGRMLVELRAGVAPGSWETYLDRLCKLVSICGATAHHYIHDAQTVGKLTKSNLRALTDKSVDLSIRRNVDNAIRAQEEFPNLTPDEIARKVNRAEKPRGQNSHRGEVFNKAEAGDKSQPVLDRKTVENAWLADQCVTFVKILLGIGKYESFSGNKKLAAAIKLAESIHAETAYSRKKGNHGLKKAAAKKAVG